ncbi:unnamed protein product [Vitrella brassicaformis CCMP3155]|uniref:Protein kinase domain-containing protein n=1 Tax=Vitrella brassicaformis (strain CCMP3155) TaxID=1169540 RepID=A0A0G4GKF1_VITBC|nr:unnamed protein product [Vitrella brassicaformis CCMP3155]|eukprot:CEM30500.1 unnamed protein product [Vitrella brassicaformis CCMP3155]
MSSNSIFSGRFDVQAQPFGEGAYSTVHRAKDRAYPDPNRLFAMKIFKPVRRPGATGGTIHLSSLNEVLLYDVLQSNAEARALAAGRSKELYRSGWHPNIVKRYGSFLDHSSTRQGDQWLQLELLDGYQSADKWMTSSVLSDADIKAVLYQSVRMLAFLHELGIAHGDISRANLLVRRGEGGLPIMKAIDFGLSVHPKTPYGGHGEGSGTFQGAKGTPGYVTPEMAWPYAAHDDPIGCGLFPAYSVRQGDIFQAGVLGLEMATGKNSWKDIFPLATPSNTELANVSRTLFDFTGRPTGNEAAAMGLPPGLFRDIDVSSGERSKAKIRQLGVQHEGLISVLSKMLCLPTCRWTAAQLACHPYFDDPALTPLFAEYIALGFFPPTHTTAPHAMSISASRPEELSTSAGSSAAAVSPQETTTSGVGPHRFRRSRRKSPRTSSRRKSSARGGSRRHRLHEGLLDAFGSTAQVLRRAAKRVKKAIMKVHKALRRKASSVGLGRRGRRTGSAWVRGGERKKMRSSLHV